MAFLEVASLEDLRTNFVANKWGILEPTPESIPARRSGVALVGQSRVLFAIVCNCLQRTEKDAQGFWEDVIVRRRVVSRPKKQALRRTSTYCLLDVDTLDGQPT